MSGFDPTQGMSQQPQQNGMTDHKSFLKGLLSNFLFSLGQGLTASSQAPPGMGGPAGLGGALQAPEILRARQLQEQQMRQQMALENARQQEYLAQTSKSNTLVGAQLADILSKIKQREETDEVDLSQYGLGTISTPKGKGAELTKTILQGIISRQNQEAKPTVVAPGATVLPPGSPQLQTGAEPFTAPKALTSSDQAAQADQANYAQLLNIKDPTTLSGEQKVQARNYAKLQGTPTGQWIAGFVNQNKRFPNLDEINKHDLDLISARIPAYQMGSQAVVGPTGDIGIPRLNRRTGQIEVSPMLPGPTMQERTILAQAIKINTMINGNPEAGDPGIVDLIDRVAAKGGMGFAKGQIENWRIPVGLENDQDVSDLFTEFKSLAAMQPIIHGMRGGEQMYKLMQDAIGSLARDPESAKGSLRGLTRLANINIEEGRLGGLAASAGRKATPGPNVNKAINPPKIGDVKTFPNGKKGKYDGTGWVMMP
jgi:hypothetical protein